MTRFDANEPAQRRALVAEAVLAHRKRASEAAVFEVLRDSDTGGGGERSGLDDETGGGGERSGLDDETGGGHAESVRLTYAHGALTFECTPGERERLEDLLADFSVFKLQQPDTRTAAEDIVHVSAVADPKHAADFVDAAFRRVYGLDETYRVWVARV